ncbi:DUF4339 domain-containing protein [Terricaulis sp.]|uniref:DUF4339 domain-containing protein n=1 Tax=Terricaulis sp. TaxID=2768686 RepID=UPI00378446A1
MWHYTSGGGRHGPVSEQEMASLIASGHIRPSAFVREDASTEWREAKDTALARYFPEAVVSQARAEEAQRLRPARSSGGFGNLIGFGIALAVVALIVFVGVGGLNRIPGGERIAQAGESVLPPAMLSDEALARRLQAEFERSENYRSMQTFSRFKTMFPDDYQGLIRTMVPLYRRNANADDAFAAAEAHMTEFLHTNKPAMLRADPEAIGAILHAEATLIGVIRAENPSACAIAIDTGSVTREHAQTLIRGHRVAFDAMNLALFNAIRSGQTAQNEYAPLGEEEWGVLGRALMEEGGITPDQLQRFGANMAGLSDAEKCQIVSTLLTFMDETPDMQLRARYAASIVREM